MKCALRICSKSAWFIVFAGFLAVFAQFKASAAPPPGYYEVWGDEFDGTSLDTTKWWVWDQPDRSGYTTPDAATVGGGYLTLHTYTEDGTNFSPIISSDPRFREKYGYVEASVEFNGSPGMFSDFWIQSANNGQIIGDPAASGAELDVCEHRATDANNADNITGEVTIDLHWNGYGANKSTASSGLVGSGLGSGFHTYGLLWSSSNYDVSFDGAPIWTTNVGVSQRSEVIMLSSEVDSNSFCGIVPAGGYGSFLVSTTSTVVDYVRFYAPTTTVYWLGASSANWLDSGNWLSNMVPSSACDVVFSYLSVGNFNISLASNTTVNSISFEESPAISIGGNTLTVNGGGLDLLSTLNDTTINSALVLGAPQTWNVAEGYALILTGAMSGPGSLTLNGPGYVALEATNTASGATTVSNGTLLVYSTITNAVTVAGGAVTGTGTMTGPVVVNAGTLSGTETITGSVVVNMGAEIAPGSSIGTMILSNTLTLQPGSFTLIDVNQATGAASQITGLTTLNYGGTLVVSNLGGTLAAGNSFQVFSSGQYSGAFTRITPSAPGNGLAWDTTALYTQGLLQVITTNTALITAQLTNGQISLAWPAANTGWILQSQTNPPGQGLTTNWVTVAGSSLTNFINFTINPSVGSVFYRLAEPSYTTAVFGSGDLIVMQVGNGAIYTNGTPGFLNDYSIFGGPMQAQVALPTTGPSSLVFGGSPFDGVLSLSSDGKSIVIAGYNVPANSSPTAIDSSSSTGVGAVPRGVGSVRANGIFTMNATTTNFSGSNIRTAAADGLGNFWAGGGIGGVVYLGSNAAPATLSTLSGSTRNLMFVNGSLYYSETGSGQCLYAFSGAPLTAATPSLKLNTTSTGTGTASPVDFACNSALTIVYVADNRTASTGGGVQRFNKSGSTWVYEYTLTNTVTSSGEVEELAVNFSGANPVIYAITAESTANQLITTTDTGNHSVFTSLETAPSGDAFRGVVFAPSGN